MAPDGIAQEIIHKVFDQMHIDGIHDYKVCQIFHYMLFCIIIVSRISKKIYQIDWLLQWPKRFYAT